MGMSDVDGSEPQPPSLPAPPWTVRAEVLPGGLELVVPWRRDMGTLRRLLPLMMAITCGLAAVELGGPGLIVLIPTMVVALYFWLMYELNATTILIGTGAIEVSHGPLPTVFPTQVVTGNRLRNVRVVERSMLSNRGGRISRYALQPVQAGVLMKNWSNRETLEYVRTVLETVFRERPSTRGGTAAPAGHR